MRDLPWAYRKMRLAVGEIAAILESSCGVPGRVAERYSIDSRTLLPGSLFFAIRGPRLDGHEFVVQALGGGAVAAVVERDFVQRAPAEWRSALIPVQDTTGALQQLARGVRRKWGGRVVGVTGSTGKTTTKELIAAVLATQLNVHRSAANLNNQFGVPLTLLGLEPEHDVAVVEMGMSGAGEIASLAEIAEPEIGVVTNVAPVHLEFFDSLEGIARAKRELIDHLKAPGAAVLNEDDSRVRGFREGFGGEVVTYGFSPGAKFRAMGAKSSAATGIDRAGMSFHVEGPGVAVDLFLPLAGHHNVANALAAIATASLFGAEGRPFAEPHDLQQALHDFEAPHQRGEILGLDRKVTVINDSYNSNPLALERMLETLAGWPDAGRKIVVAGEMLELGSSSPDWHRAAGRKCAEVSVDWLVAVQGEAKLMVEGAIQAGLARNHTNFFATAAEAAEYVPALVRAGDVVLVKGSRGVHLERVVEALERSIGRTSRAAREPRRPIANWR